MSLIFINFDSISPQELDVDDLMNKCYDGKLEEVKELIGRFGAKTVVDARDDKSGRSCLCLSCWRGKNANLTWLLLQNGADPNEKSGSWNVLTRASNSVSISNT